MTDLQSTIDTYLDAYGEGDADRRDQLVSQAWAEDGQLIDPPLDGAGRAGISEMAAAVQTHYPEHAFRRTSGIDEHHSFARYEWELVAPDGTIALTGLDVAELGDDGLLRRVVGFLGPLPERES
ncbi:hypothetical protein BH20ACT2_BH20ACT2_22490 [soil metagenome]